MKTLTLAERKLDQNVSGISSEMLNSWAEAVEKSVATVDGGDGIVSVEERVNYDHESNILVGKVRYTKDHASYSVVIRLDNADRSRDCFEILLVDNKGDVVESNIVNNDAVFGVEDIEEVVNEFLWMR